MKTRKYFIYLLLLFLLTFFWRATTNAYSTMLPLIAKYQFNFSPSLIMYLGGIGGIGSFITSFFINQRVKKVRPYFISSIALLLLIVALVPFYTRTNVWLFILIEGVATGATSPLIISSAGTVEDPKERERAIAFYSLALSTSLAVAPFISSGFLILTNENLRVSLAMFSALVLISLISAFFMRLSGRNQAEIKRSGIINRPDFWKAVAANTIYTFPFVAMTYYGAILARQAFNVSYSVSVAMYSAFFITSFLTRFYLTVRPVRSIDRSVTLGSVLTVLGLVLVGTHLNLALFLLGYAILGFPHGLFWPVALIILRRSYRDEEIYAANSYYISVNNVVWLLTPFISGLIASFVGISLTFIVVIVPTVAIYLVYAYLARVSKASGSATHDNLG
ncbi:MAG: MFS transporter [Conexivisphaerales archaeon]|nr:MFS transporter [Conexivisphaerales archaeon]